MFKNSFGDMVDAVSTCMSVNLSELLLCNIEMLIHGREWV